MDDNKNFPAIERLSLIIAPLLLVYSFFPFIDINRTIIRFSISGLVFPFEINFSFLIFIIIAAMAACGIDWLIQDHPKYNPQSRVQHWILPAMTTWAIGMPLASLSSSQFWIMLFLGAILLCLVFTAEYIIIDPDDFYQPLAAAALTALSLGLFLILTIAERSNSLRLYLGLPAVFVASAAIVLRSIYLRSRGKWNYPWGICLAIVMSQIATGFHYLPIKPLSYGVLMTGCLFGLIEAADVSDTDLPKRKILIIPLLSLAIFSIMAYFTNL
jgi:hypothetical protein